MTTMTRQFASRATTAVLILLSASTVPLNQAQSTTTTTTTSTTPASNATTDEVIVNPGGTCGNGGGDRGNGICANGKCCSKFGWCGTTPAHCDGETFPPTLAPSGGPSSTLEPEISTTLEPASNPPSSRKPTLQPTARDWSLITPGHTSFCGPKIVGGYEIAKSMCSYSTECGKSEATDTHFGANGNDCPEPYMCFTDIICEPPTSSPSYMPSGMPSMSGMPSVTASDLPSGVPSMSSVPTPKGQTKTPTYPPTISNYPTQDPTVNPNNIVNTMITRGSFCGNSYEEAVTYCSENTLCSSDEDCSSFSAAGGGGSGGSGGALCFPGISCSADVIDWNSENEDMSVNALNNGGREWKDYYWRSGGVTIMMMIFMLGAFL